MLHRTVGAFGRERLRSRKLVRKAVVLHHELYMAAGSLSMDSPFGVYTAGTQSSDVDLAPGQEIFAKVLADNTRVASGDTTDFVRDTFYLWLVPAEVARAQIAANRT